MIRLALQATAAGLVAAAVAGTGIATLTGHLTAAGATLVCLAAIWGAQQLATLAPE